MEYKHLESHGNRNRDCDCPLSCTSYPHWPPTSLKEAFDQLYLLQDQHNRHRRYLAHQWWAFVRSQASIRPVYERDVDTADILALCPCIQVDLDKDLSATEWPAGWSHNYCRIVLESRSRNRDVFNLFLSKPYLWLSYSWCTVNFLGLTDFMVSTTKIRWMDMILLLSIFYSITRLFSLISYI